MRYLTQRNVGVQGLVLWVSRVADVVVVSTCDCGHHLQKHLRFRVRLAPRLRPVLQRNRPTARLLREHFAARRIHAKRAAISIVIRQIVVVEQLLSCSLVGSRSVGISIRDLSLQLLVLLDLVLLLQRRVHVGLDRLLTIAPRLEYLRLVLRLLRSEGVQLARVLRVAVLDSQYLVLRQLLTGLRFE